MKRIDTPHSIAGVDTKAYEKKNTDLSYLLNVVEATKKLLCILNKGENHSGLLIAVRQATRAIELIDPEWVAIQVAAERAKQNLLTSDRND